MAGHLLSVLEPSVVLQVNCDPGCPPGMTSNRREKTRRLRPLSYCCPGVVPIKSSSGHGCPKRINALEQGLQDYRIGIGADISFWIVIVSDRPLHQRLQVLPGSRLCSLIRASQGIPKTRPLSLTPSTLL